MLKGYDKGETGKKRKDTEEKITDQYDVIKHTLDVHNHDLKDILGNDYVISHLDEEEKQYVIEQVGNARAAREIILTSIGLAKKQGIKIDKTEENAIRREAELAYDVLMVKTKAMAILSRNNPQNWLVDKVIGTGGKEEDKEYIFCCFIYFYSLFFR